MRRHASAVLGVAAALTLVVSAVPAEAAQPASWGHHPPTATVEVALQGLNLAKPVNVAHDGDVIFAQAAADGSGLLQEYATHGWRKGKVRTLATLKAVPSDVAAGPGDSIWVLFGAAGGPESGPPPPGIPANLLYLWVPWHGGKLLKIADIGAWEATHPDPGDLEGKPGDSNAYGLAALHDGSVLVADAAANAVLRVWPTGRIRTVVHLPTELVSTSHIPADQGLPPMLPAEAVPTSVAVGPDGAWYVGELKGFPFTPGTSRVWRIKPGTYDKVCTANTWSRSCRIAQTGFTSIIDITFAPRSGALYVQSLSAGGVLAVEGPPGTPPPPGQLLRISPRGHRTEVAPGQITLPGGVAVDRRGTIYVTTNQLIPQQGQLLRIT